MKPTLALFFALLAIAALALSGCVTTTYPDGKKVTRFDNATAGEALKLTADVLVRALFIKAQRDDVLVSEEGKRIVPFE